MANMTVTTADKHIQDVWPGAIIRAAEFNMIWAQRIYRKWKFMGYGDVYHFPRIPNIETATKSASSDWTPSAYTDTEQTVTVNTHQVCGFKIEDIVKVLESSDLESEMRKKIGYSLSRAFDVNIATLPQSFSQTQGTLGVELTFDQLMRAWRYLADSGLDTANDCWIVISPAAQAGLKKLDTFISSEYQGPSPMMVEKNTIGRFQGMDITYSNLTRAPSAGQSESSMHYRQAMAAIVAQAPKIITEYSALSLAMIVGGHQIYGYAEIDRYSETPGNVTATDEWCVLLKTIG